MTATRARSVATLSVGHARDESIADSAIVSPTKLVVNIVTLFS